MRFLLGLIIGVALGAGSMYVWLTQPAWLSTESVPDEIDAGVLAKGDDGERKRKRKRRGRRGAQQASASAPEQGAIPVLSEDDRRLVWRGEKVALPPRQVDFADEESARPLRDGEINAVIERQSEAVLSCITKARGNAPLDAQIRLEMLVSGEGRVNKMRVRAPVYLFAHGFEACARKAARQMRFPVTGAATIVEVPYDLY